MRYFKIMPIGGVFDARTTQRITRMMRNSVLNEGIEYGRRGCLNFFRIERIEKVEDGRIFTLTDRDGVPYVFKVLNGYLYENKQRGELKTREELSATAESAAM